MPDFTALKAKLGDWMGANTTRLPDSVRGDLINQAMRELLQLHELRFGEISDTFATVAATRNYTLPTGFSRPYRIWYLDPDDGSSLVEVEYINKDLFIRKFPDVADTSDPSHYTIWGSNIQLGPTPSRIITINREYYRILPDLVAGTDTNAFTTEFWEPIFWRALAMVTKYLIEDARAPMIGEEARASENRLIIEYAGVRSSGFAPTCEEPG